MTPRILFVGGASIGHIAPSLAVLQQLQELLPLVEHHFVCLPRKLEMEYLEENRCTFSTIDSPRLSPAFLWRFPQAYKRASALLSAFAPTVVFSKGGYLSVPVCLAAWRRGIPIVLHESDAVSGYANRITARWARKICTGFPAQKSDRRYIHTGNPVRQEITKGKRNEGLRITGFLEDRPTLLIIGGSQGAQALNAAIAQHIHVLLEICNVIHLTGRGKVGAALQDTRYFQREFVNEELPHLYAISTLALSRAGANTLSELAANNIPTIIVPLRGVGHDHQQKNAEASLMGGGCILLDQKDLKNKIVETVKNCLEKKEVHKSMPDGKKSPSSTEASLQIAKILSEFLASQGGSH